MIERNPFAQGRDVMDLVEIGDARDRQAHAAQRQERECQQRAPADRVLRCYARGFHARRVTVGSPD
jgi:hypothetical protein